MFEAIILQSHSSDSEAYVPKHAEELIKQTLDNAADAVYYEFSEPQEDETEKHKRAVTDIRHNKAQKQAVKKRHYRVGVKLARVCGRVHICYGFKVFDNGVYCDYLSFELEKLSDTNKMRGTAKTFFLEAYVPKHAEELIKQTLDNAADL